MDNSTCSRKPRNQPVAAYVNALKNCVERADARHDSQSMASAHAHVPQMPDIRSTTKTLPTVYRVTCGLRLLHSIPCPGCHGLLGRPIRTTRKGWLVYQCFIAVPDHVVTSAGLFQLNSLPCFSAALLCISYTNRGLSFSFSFLLVG